jgi:hypothetical protein
MKMFKTLAITIIFSFLVSTSNATELNGRINIINNDGTNFKVLLQINTDVEPRELGGATIIINYDNSKLSYPDEPIMGVDFIFYNFNSGYYDEAKVTKVTENQIWINVDLISDEYGTIVTNGPYQWTNLVLLNFGTNGIITSNVVFWDIYNSYWGVYDSDNATTWEIGNFDNLTTSIENETINDQPNSYILDQNYPNPFNPITTIKYDLPNTSDVSLIIYDILGRKVKELVNTKQQAGRYEIQFNASTLASGVYIYQLISEKYINSKKMILLK